LGGKGIAFKKGRPKGALKKKGVPNKWKRINHALPQEGIYTN